MATDDAREGLQVVPRAACGALRRDGDHESLAAPRVQRRRRLHRPSRRARAAPTGAPSSTTSARSPTASSQSASPAPGTPCSPGRAARAARRPVHARLDRLPDRLLGRHQGRAWSRFRSTRCSRPHDYAFMLQDSRARVLVVSDALHEKLAPAAAASPSPPPRREDERARRRCSRRLPLPSTPPPRAPTTSPSGSTRRARPGRRRARSTCTRTSSHTAALYGAGVLGIREDDVVFSAAKLFFAYGLGNAMTFPLHVGATAVLMAERPTPAAVMRTMKAHRPTIFGGVPTLFASILADASLDRAAGSDRLRVSISAGEALPRHVGERWRERFGTDILDGIGSTEMLHIFLSNRHGDVRYGTSGKPVPGYDVKLVDDERRARRRRRGGRALGARPVGVRRLLEPARARASPPSTARGRARATATCATPTATTPTRAAPTTCSRSAASGSRPSRWRARSPRTRRCSRRRSSATRTTRGS